MRQPEFDYLGPYKIEKELGRGGMGTVYKGAHARSGEQVAVKVIAQSVADQSRFRRRFNAEIETLFRLSHPNIVKLIGTGETQGLPFYSMEYVDGHTLQDFLRSRGGFPWEDVIQIGIETSAALKHAHDFGIIHRDLKPANLMLNSKGQVKLTDFGISRLFDVSQMTACGTVIGTVDFMSPEQAEGKPVTTRSDLYSLGCVLYALLAGSAPFSGKSVPEVLYAVRYNPVPNLQDKVPGCPPDLVALILELMEKDPQKRPPTALVVANRLKALQLGLQKIGLTNHSITDPASSGPIKAIGSELTSLDLSDSEDDELRVTNGDALSTREQLTMLAPVAESPLSFVTDKQGTSPIHNEVAANDRAVDEPVSRESANSSKLVSGAAGKANLQSPNKTVNASLPSSSTHFKDVKDKDFRSPYGSPANVDMHRYDWLHYASIVGMIILLVAAIGYGWWMLQPASADDLYNVIAAASDADDENELLAITSQISEFLARFPTDPRHAEVQTIADETELTRVTRILERRVTNSAGMSELSLIEQAFLESMQARAKNSQEGREKIAVFLKVFGPLDLNAKDGRLVKLAEFAAQASPKRRTAAPASEELEKLVRGAEEQLRGAELNAYYRNLLLLYDGKPWATEQLARIRARIAPEASDGK